MCNVYDQKGDMKQLNGDTAGTGSNVDSTSAGAAAATSTETADEITKLLSLYSSNQWWGDHFLLQLKDMIAETCNNRHVLDCDFFINKRDYPQLKYNNEQLDLPVEPYGFIFNKDDRDPGQDIPLSRELYTTYAPIL